MDEAPPQFDPAYIHDVDPTVTKQADFDFAEVLERLDGELRDLTEKQREDLGRALRELLIWCVKSKSTSLKTVGKRLALLVWIIDPQTFDGAPLRKLARRFRMSRSSLVHTSAEVSRRFGIRNRSQIRHNANWRPDTKPE